MQLWLATPQRPQGGPSTEAGCPSKLGNCWNIDCAHRSRSACEFLAWRRTEQPANCPCCTEPSLQGIISRLAMVHRHEQGAAIGIAFDLHLLASQSARLVAWGSTPSRSGFGPVRHARLQSRVGPPLPFLSQHGRTCRSRIMLSLSHPHPLSWLPSSTRQMTPVVVPAAGGSLNSLRWHHPSL